MKLDPFIEAEKIAGHSVTKTCGLFEVSRSAYYLRSTGEPSVRSVTDAELTEKIKAIHVESKGTYGSPRVHQELVHHQVVCVRRRVTRLMRVAPLEGRCKKRWRKTTIANPEAEVAKDLIQRQFGHCEEIDRRYVGDITYIATWESWATELTEALDGSCRAEGVVLRLRHTGSLLWARRSLTVCGFYRFAHIDGRVATNPAQYVRRPKVHPSEGRGLDRREFGTFLYTAERFDQDHAALAVLLGLNGLRVSEACGTNVENLGLDHGHRTLRILGKGNKPAVVPLVPRASRTIDLASPSTTSSPWPVPIATPDGPT